MDAKLIEDTRGRRLAQNSCDQPCAIEKGMRIIGGKWTGSILWHLRDGPIRFNDLSRLVGGASKKMIVERLRHLEAHGLVVREVMQTAPVTVQYSLTELGQTAIALLGALQAWSDALPSEVLRSPQPASGPTATGTRPGRGGSRS